MSKISREQVLKLAKLSYLSLSEDEIEQYRKELSSVLEYVEVLNDIDVAGFQPTYQVTGLQNVMRPDKAYAQQASPDELLKRLPRKEGRYIKVGRMI